MVAGAVLLGGVWVFLLRFVPRGETVIVHGTHASFRRAVELSCAISDRPRRSCWRFCCSSAFWGAGYLPAGCSHPWGESPTRPASPRTGSLSHRIRLPGRRDEFRELADAFDTMLAQLEAHVAEQQRFAANASHELRTPLAITQTLLDVARNDPNRDTGELVDRLHAVNTRAIDLTEALLLLSRADQQSFTPAHVDLSLMAEEATETLIPLAEKQGVTIKTSVEMTPTIGSEALLLQLSTNLVHNAIVHNLPEQGTVWITTSLHPNTVALTVENTGEKLTPQVASTLVEPFLRGTERIHTDHAGVGLGLVIVKSITQAHDGTLTLTPRPAGGLCVTVQLPVAPPRAGR
ncbi:MAG: HAMP domain-containing sensor histidine kinase [Acidimicrobiales bacterium]|jgi:two-component system sensor histidine kinase VanS